MKENSWADLGIKEKLAIGTAIVAFLLGWIITGLAAFVPILISEQGTLWILGQSMVYCASVFGVTSYFTSETRRMKHDLRMMMNEERKKIEEEFEENDEQ